MQFKHPEILYALFLLIIPIIVHLFQLRRFKKVPFTNIAFLKEVVTQTRKSSQLKKLLTLLARLLLVASIILAFSQPYLGAIKNNIETDTYIYLDNSFSMQAKSNNGELLKRAIQDIINGTKSLERIHLFTNNHVYKNLSGKDLKNTLLSIKYSPVKTNLNTVLLKIKTSFQHSKHAANVFLISDFQEINIPKDIKLDSLANFYISQLHPITTNNISIDSVYIAGQDNESIHLKTMLKNFGNNDENVSVSLFNNTILAGKSTAFIAKKSTTSIEFTIPVTNTFDGKLQIDDSYIPFDNSLFFTLHKPSKINVTAIGKNNHFLAKIYTKNEFNFISTPLQTFDYNTIEAQHLLILNEVASIPNELIAILKNFVSHGGNLVIIPPIDLHIDNYPIVRMLNLGKLTAINKNELAISTINFAHPFLKGVFEKQIKNFQYPTVKNSYEGIFKNATSILKLENNKSFISQVRINKGNIYWFSAPINSENSNFKSSPLIVPVFYNFGLHSIHPSQLYYTIGITNTFEVATHLPKDAVIHLITATEDFVPHQQIAAKKVTLITESNPSKSGIVTVQNQGEIVQKVAYNYNRSESDLSIINAKKYFKEDDNITYIDSVNDAFSVAVEGTNTTNLWHIFVILALLFSLVEILLLKFLKP